MAALTAVQCAVQMIQKEGSDLVDPVHLFDEGSTVDWIPCGRKLTCSFPGIKSPLRPRRVVRFPCSCEPFVALFRLLSACECVTRRNGALARGIVFRDEPRVRATLLHFVNVILPATLQQSADAHVGHVRPCCPRPRPRTSRRTYEHIVSHESCACRYGNDVSVLEMDGQFDNLEELIYVESHLSNTSAKFYGEITQQARLQHTTRQLGTCATRSGVGCMHIRLLHPCLRQALASNNMRARTNV